MKMLLWSGGCDSTILLNRYLEAGEDVRTLAINHDQILCGPMEKIARAKIRAELKKRGHKFEHHEITIKSGRHHIQVEHGIVQPALWLSLAILHLRDDETLVLAYIRGDDVWHVREHICQTFLSITSSTCFRNRSLDFPMEWDIKPEIIRELKEARLFDLTWYCEKPNRNKTCCGRCGSCRRMQAARKLVV